VLVLLNAMERGARVARYVLSDDCMYPVIHVSQKY